MARKNAAVEDVTTVGDVPPVVGVGRRPQSEEKNDRELDCKQKMNELESPW